MFCLNPVHFFFLQQRAVHRRHAVMVQCGVTVCTKIALVLLAVGSKKAFTHLFLLHKVHERSLKSKPTNLAMNIKKCLKQCC